MFHEKLSDSVSREELMHMRENGMMNRQIAESLGVSYQTVVRYIGKQPDGLRGNYGETKTRAADIPRDKPTERRVTLTKQFQKTVYAGETFNYTVNSGGQVVITKRGEDDPRNGPFSQLAIDAGMIGAMVTELLDIVWILKEGER